MEAPSFTGLCSVWTYFTKIYMFRKKNTKKNKIRLWSISSNVRSYMPCGGLGMYESGIN